MSISHAASNDADSKLRHSTSHEFGTIPFHLSLTQLGDPSNPALTKAQLYTARSLSRPFFDSRRWGWAEGGKIVEQTSWFEFARGFETKQESRSKIAYGDNCGGAVAKTQVRCRVFGLKIVIRWCPFLGGRVNVKLGRSSGGMIEILGTLLMHHGAYSRWPGLPMGTGKEVIGHGDNLPSEASKCIKNLHVYVDDGTRLRAESTIGHRVLKRVETWNLETAGIILISNGLAAKVSMRIQLCFFTFRSRVRPEVRPIPDAFLLNSLGCGGYIAQQSLALGSGLLLTGSCMFHPHHPSWLVDAGALPASPAAQRIIVLGDPDVRLVHPLLDNPLFARTVLVVPSSNPAKWTPVGEYSSSASLVILRTNKKHSKGGALHLLSVLQRAARTPLKPVKRYSQYDYEGREETFGFVPMSTMAEDTSEVESAGVLPVPSFHAVINFFDGRTGSEREALRTGILTTSLVGGFLLTGNGKGKTQVTVPRRASRLSFLSRRPSPTPPTATGEEAEHGAEERCAHVIHVIPPSSTLPSKTVQNLEHFLINHCRTAASTSSLPAPIPTAKSVTHYSYILPFNLLLSSHGPSILDFALAGALDGGESKAWIRSMHDVRVAGGSVKMHGSGLPTPPDSEEELGGVKGGYQLSNSPPSDAEEERRRTLRALEKGKARERVGSTLGQNPVRYSQLLTGGGSIRLSRSDGTGENARRPTSRDRRRSERSKLEHDHSQSRSKSDHGHRSIRPTTPQRAQTVSSKHTSRTTKPSRSLSTTKYIPPHNVPSALHSPTVAKPHPVHHTHTHARRPSDTHVSQALPSLPTPRNTPPITMKSNATWNAREKPLPSNFATERGVARRLFLYIAASIWFYDYMTRVHHKADLCHPESAFHRVPEFTLCLALGLSAEASVKPVYPLYEQASHALSRLADLFFLASILPDLGFDNRVEIRRR
ncbi:hypothetical protein EDD18DRAFT_1099742 [Armillaria luteobubalina]|uniref:Uncharacterized protein n=1 Tax=Armillaria luteobubalina TaxID=153913 RepID=A0AA39QGW3_9AGAR|nr:hypothetical protein EDD18DRAFT_1099742 [Armillaria luteobubalina]